MAGATAASKTRETVIGSAILVVLAVIAVCIFFKQFQYDPAIFTAALPKDAVPAANSPAAAAPSALQAYLPEGLIPLSGIESFSPETLSDKIDGKAELYLPAGFVSMQCQRFAREGNRSAWIEVFVYDMGSAENAFSVFSVQRRAGAESSALTRFAYRTENALFFVQGKDYVEIVAATDGMDADMEGFGRNFIAARPVEEKESGDAVPFAPDHLEEGSIALHASDVFGFDKLDRTYLARYNLGGSPLTAFLSRRASTQEASDLAAAYAGFLVENGGKEETTGLDIPGVKLIQLFDTFELVFSKGELLAGVHEAESKETAERLGNMLYLELMRTEGGTHQK